MLTMDFVLYDFLRWKFHIPILYKYSNPEQSNVLCQHETQLQIVINGEYTNTLN
jgi:hypothetical protein